MSEAIETAKLNQGQNALRPGTFTVKSLMRPFHLTFVSGPWLLFTSRLSFKNAFLMFMLCVPSLLFCSLLTFPALIFQRPEQQAYYQFAHTFNQDPANGIIFAIVALCILIALAVPANEPRATSVARH
jgi:hypothetical protein